MVIQRGNTKREKKRLQVFHVKAIQPLISTSTFTLDQFWIYKIIGSFCFRTRQRERKRERERETEREHTECLSSNYVAQDESSATDSRIHIPIAFISIILWGFFLPLNENNKVCTVVSHRWWLRFIKKKLTKIVVDFIVSTTLRFQITFFFSIVAWFFRLYLSFKLHSLAHFTYTTRTHN